MKRITFFIFSILTLVLAQSPKTNTIQLRPIQTATDSVFVINSSKDLYYIKVKTNTGGVLGGVVLAMNQSTGDLSLTIGGSTYTANLGTQNDFESASYSSATGEITLTANDGTNTVLTIDGSETKLTGGAGINLTGNGTSATPYNVEALDVSPTNELQTLGLSGSVLSISGANSLTLPNTSPVLVASNDLIISGGNLMTGAPLTQNTETVQNGFSRSFTGGNFGLGTPFPNNVLEVNGGFLDSTGLRFTQVTKYTPKSTGENAYLAVNSLGNIVVGDTIKGCPDTIVNYNSHKFIGVRGGNSNILGWDFSTFQIIPNAENLYVTFADNNGLQDALIGAGTIQDFLINIIDFYTNSFQPATGNTSVLTYVENGSFGYIQVTGLNNNLQMQIRNDGTGTWGYGNNSNPDNDGLEGFAPLSIGGGISDCEIIDIAQDSFNYATDKVFFVRESSEQTQVLNGTYLGWSYPLGVQWDTQFNAPFLAENSYITISTDGLGSQILTIPTPKTYNSLSEYETDINGLAATYGSSFRVKFNATGDYAFLTDLVGNPLLNSDPYLITFAYSNFQLLLENNVSNFVFKNYNPTDVTVSNFDFITSGAQDSMYYGSLPDLSSQASRLNYRAYTSPDSALFWNGDSLYLDNFANLVSANSAKDSSTWYKVGTTLPSDNISDNIYRDGNVGIGTNNPNYRLQVSQNNAPTIAGAGTAKLVAAFSDSLIRVSNGEYYGLNFSFDGGMGIGYNSFLQANKNKKIYSGGADDDYVQIGNYLDISLTSNDDEATAGIENRVVNSSSFVNSGLVAAQQNAVLNTGGGTMSGGGIGISSQVANTNGIMNTASGIQSSVINASNTMTSATTGTFQSIASNGGKITDAIGVLGAISANGANSNVTNAVGMRLQTNQVNTGTIDNYVGLNVNTIVPAITNNSLVLLGTAVQQTGNYGIANSSTYDNYFQGELGLGVTSPSNNLHIGTASVANTGGVRLPITSASAAQVGQPIGVDANGDIVRIAGSSGGITSLGGQTGLTQTLSVTNTASAQGWTSVADNHSLNLRAWDLNGNAGTNQALNFVGTTDLVDLAFRANNTERMRIYQNGGVGIGTPTPSAKVLSSELSVQTGGFTRVSATHTTTGTTGRSEFFTGTNTASGFGAFGYANAGFAAPFTGVATAYGYITLSAATDLLIGQNGQAQPMWEFKATTGNTGIGTNNPQVKLDVNGGLATEVRTVTVSGALVVADHVTLINNGATAFTVTLPAAASFTGRHIIVKRIDNTSTGAITINTAGGQVQALAGTLGATTSLAAIGTYGQAAHFISNGTNWYRIN